MGFPATGGACRERAKKYIATDFFGICKAVIRELLHGGPPISLPPGIERPV